MRYARMQIRVERHARIAGSAAFSRLIRGAAQDWPARPVTMIVPYAAGGPVDTVGRIMAQGLSEVLGQQVIVENIGGAGGMTGANRVAKATPDGYTFLLGGSATLTRCRRSTARRRCTIRSPTSRM